MLELIALIITILFIIGFIILGLYCINRDNHASILFFIASLLILFFLVVIIIIKYKIEI
jgi:hypothetical protein